MSRTESDNDLYFVDVPQFNADLNDVEEENFIGRLPAPPVPLDYEVEHKVEEERKPVNSGLFAELEDVPMISSSKKKSFNRGPKLDVSKMLSDRGLPALRNLSGNLKFRGTNNVYEDLNQLMSKLEHWAHRLYPKYKFDDTLEKIEMLGGKSQIRVAMQKMRMGLAPVDQVLQNNPSDNENSGEDSEIEYDESEATSLSYINIHGAQINPTSEND